MLDEDISEHMVKRVVRQGKYLFFDLGPKIIMVHLGMSGSFRITHKKKWKHRKHDHWGLRAGPWKIYYNDPRRFGRFHIHSSSDLPELKKRNFANNMIEWYSLGPDALNFVLEIGDSDQAVDFWRERLKFSSPKVEVKQALLNQAIVAGIGNIYASEILHNARINPFLPVGQISNYMLSRMSTHSSKTLRWAIRNGGTTFPGANPYKNAHGKIGDHFKKLAVYARAGKKCRSCRKARIKQEVQGGRKTFWCPSCQPKSQIRK